MSDQTKQQETRSLPATFAKNEFEKDAFILRQLVTKDFKIKYRRSVLGVAWSVLNPLLMMIVMAIVFSTIFGQGRNGSMTPEMYPLYLIVGNITFAVMSESTNPVSYTHLPCAWIHLPTPAFWWRENAAAYEI